MKINKNNEKMYIVTIRCRRCGEEIDLYKSEITSLQNGPMISYSPHVCPKRKSLTSKVFFDIVEVRRNPNFDLKGEYQKGRYNA